MKNESIKTLQKSKSVILENWMNIQLQEDGLRDTLIHNDDQRIQSEELLDAFLKGLNEQSIEDPMSRDFEKAADILAGISITRAKQGFSPRETGVYVFGLKEALANVLSKEVKDITTLYTDTLKINKILDSLAINSFETFIKGREEVIFRQTNEITEIANPVIQVWDGVLAMPIIGTLDSSRSQVVMESLLQRVVETESNITILDISGVAAVDSLVAQHLIKTVSAIRLMGAECIISGIRPEIAQTIVHLGIDLSNIITKATMSNALKTAFNLMQVEVIKKSRNLSSKVIK